MKMPQGIQEEITACRKHQNFAREPWKLRIIASGNWGTCSP